ncbi:hypothetical protein [Endozoicomonas montiporae]|uniref:Uncharacterized protein n=1 Tax=Endozoicomonas montiporae CL-33 TaxID=570277 RepID=A0A142BH71_9GAMM|nr:hypothetical protein [Endozoicomonas montiporae]AMO58097.1 hypothetical protein EZMO1_4173 [Endozoicomonas montiporae CL-33]
MDGLEKRVKHLEDDVQGIKTDLAVIKSNYATCEDIQREIGGIRTDLQREAGGIREDLQREMGCVNANIEKMGRTMIMWTVGSVLATCTFIFGVVRFLS